MNTYTFLNLSPIEFEILCRDLLQVYLKIELETFKEGKDQGIDIRGWINRSDQVLIQCKRYSDFSDLKSVLKKEVDKVVKLNPKRYILCTSVSLSPGNKKTIADLFSGLLHEKDILGNSDINKLISEYADIEKRHYKLWLASTNILQALINNKVRVQSAIEQEILDKISKIYVSNDSYSEAIEIIKKEKFVVLSGNPGVGKTTLGRVLAYEFIKNGFQLVVAINSIKEAYDGFAEDVEQIILFDDFLGRNILEGRYPLNEEHQLVNFIEKVTSSKNKILILTTREYILNQAKGKYEIIKSSEIDIAKCVVDVSKYTRLVKGKILYNHIYFAGLPEEFIHAIVSSKIYLSLINHKNYNPRIIETIIKKKDWVNSKPDEYPDLLQKYFDKPYSVWQSAYEEDINSLSKLLLLVLVTLGTPLLKGDLYKALDGFVKLHSTKYGVLLNDFTFTSSIRELHNTFITTSIDSYGEVAVGFQNPSIFDFLVDYLESHIDIQQDLLSGAVFYNQLFEVFTTIEDKDAEDLIFDKPSGLIALSGKTLDIFTRRILDDFDKLNISKVSLTRYSSGSMKWDYISSGIYRKLSLLGDRKYNNYEPLKSFVKERFYSEAVPKNLHYQEHRNYLRLAHSIKVDDTINPIDMMKEYLSKLWYAGQLKSFTNFEMIYPEQYEDLLTNDESFYEKIDELVKKEVEDADKENYDDAIKDIKWVASQFEINADDEIEELTKKRDEYDDYVQSSIDNIDFDRDAERTIEDPIDEEVAIVDMFQSLEK